MFFSLDAALAALPELGERTRGALERLLPGALTLLLANPERRFPLACGPAPEVLGLRVPLLDGALAPLAAASWPVLQSSANPSGGPDARSVEDVDERIRAGVDLVLDGGELPGHAVDGGRPQRLRGRRVFDRPPRARSGEACRALLA